MSLSTKLFLIFILILMVSLPVVTSTHAQDESEVTVEVTQHDVNVWQAKVEFWREWEAHRQLMASHIAQTWEAKASFWQNFQLTD